MSKTVNGVNGPIPVSALGVTLMHEHIVSVNWNMRAAYPEWFDEDEFIAYAARDCANARAAGISTLVDVTPVCLGRSVRLAREAANRAGIQLIAATGFFHTEQQWMFFRDTDSFLRLIMADIEGGMDGTPVRPGLIKCCTDALGVTEINEKLLTASAIASKRSGLPIITHSSWQNRSALAQAALFERYGLNPKKIVLGHLGDTNDLRYLEEALAYGCYIGLDRFGDDAKNPLEERVTTLLRLYEKGYGPQLMISHDHASYVDIGPYEWRTARHVCPEDRDYNFSYFHRRAIPLLRKGGMSRAEIDGLLIDNPRAYFSQE